MVAAARAIETHHRHSLVRDEFAERFVLAARSSARLPTRIEDVELGDDDPVWGRGGRYFALRTRAFDDFLAEAAPSAPQIVLLGAGLDSRAFRLSWPAEATFYEIDRQDVSEFKTKVLAELGARTPIRHRLITADLAGGWREALLGAGFDPAIPTSWLAEGVLAYLPAAVEEWLIAAIIVLSARGSRVGFEILPGQDTPEVRENDLYATTAAKTGSHLGSLFDTDARPDSVGALRSAGWSMTSSPVAEFTARYGRGPESEIEDPITRARWVLGRKDR
jgi:methyltransferase (TIGR00027 family)